VQLLSFYYPTPCNSKRGQSLFDYMLGVVSLLRHTISWGFYTSPINLQSFINGWLRSHHYVFICFFFHFCLAWFPTHSSWDSFFRSFITPIILSSGIKVLIFCLKFYKGYLWIKEVFQLFQLLNNGFLVIKC